MCLGVHLCMVLHLAQVRDREMHLEPHLVGASEYNRNGQIPNIRVVHEQLQIRGGKVEFAIGGPNPLGLLDVSILS